MSFWPEVTTEDIELILMRAGRPMHEDEIVEAWYTLIVERSLEELADDGEIERVREPDGTFAYRARGLCHYEGCDHRTDPGRGFCRQHAGGVTRDERIAYALVLRSRGLRLNEIARKLEVDPATASTYLFEGRCAPSQDAQARRRSS